MARPPRRSGISLDNLEDVSPELLAFAEQLEPFMSDVSNALDRRLTRAENMEAEEKTLTVRTGATAAASFPLQFDHALSKSPREIRLARLVTLEGSAPTVAVDVSQWRIKSGRTVELLTVPGLQANSEYELVLVLE